MFNKLFGQKNGKTNFETKICFDTTNKQKNEIEQEAKRRGITASQFMRISADKEIACSGEGLNFEILLLENDIKHEEEYITKLEQELNVHKQKLAEYKNKHAQKTKLKNTSNIVHHEVEQEIKTIILERFTNTNKYRDNSTAEALEGIRYLANTNQVNVDITITIAQMYINKEITLLDIIKKPLQYLLDPEEVQPLDSNTFQQIREELMNKYGKIAEQEQIKIREEQQRQELMNSSENERIRHIIIETYNSNYNSYEKMISNVKYQCVKYNTDEKITLDIIQRIYSNELKYDKVIGAENILETYGSLRKPSPISQEVKEQETKKIIKKVNEIQPLDNVRNTTNLKRKVRQICESNMFVEFKEIWITILRIIDKEISLKNVLV
ncbi:hypothetical protein [Methanosphaera cuniculi]|uniref:Uncharacterized protein n=1 Tax=Methanosphaera cuniculi TaxID=1077256 RepID=A0A2A2HDU6_9EURY|nr:hypothetical protein [Methanosphaera cuniculi]PAV07466.1 hypothetical protein ASJ82_02735 [Methanosphaera cuniculi]